MQITLARNHRRNKWHIQNAGAECFAATEVSLFKARTSGITYRPVVFFNEDEPEAYDAYLDGHKGGYWDHEDVCRACHRALVRIVRARRERERRKEQGVANDQQT